MSLIAIPVAAEANVFPTGLVEKGHAVPKGVGNDWHYKAAALPAGWKVVAIPDPS